MKPASVFDLMAIITMRILQILLIVSGTILLINDFQYIDLEELFIYLCCFISAEFMLNHECDKLMNDIKERE